MSTRTDRPWKRGVASTTALLLMGLSLAVPLLDGGVASQEAVLEAEHHAASCVVGHDHTVCTQFGANLGLELPSPPSRAPLTDFVPARSSVGTVLVAHHPDRQSLPRAPPQG